MSRSNNSYLQPNAVRGISGLEASIPMWTLAWIHTLKYLLSCIFEILTATYSPVAPFFWTALVSLVATFYMQRPLRSAHWHWWNWLSLAQFLFCFPMLVLGVVYFYDGQSPVNQTAESGIGFLLLSSLPVATFWVYQMKGTRWFAFFLMAVQQLIIATTWLVSWWAITGLWPS